MPITKKTQIRQSDAPDRFVGGTSTAVGGGGGGGGAAGVEVIQLDASGGSVTETLPAPSSGATALALRVDTSTGNTATLDTPGSEEIRFAEGKNVSSTTLDVEQSLLLSSDGDHWYVEEGQGLRAKAETVTTDGATKNSPLLKQTATYDSDGTTGVTSSNVSIERYVRTDNSGNATLVYEHGGTEIAEITDQGTIRARQDVVAFGLSGGSSGGSSSNLAAPGDALTLNPTPDPDEITFAQDIEDSNGNFVLSGAETLQFKGSGVSSVSTPGGSRVEVEISGGSSVGSLSDLSDVGSATAGDGEVLIGDDTEYNSTLLSTAASNHLDLADLKNTAYGSLTGTPTIPSAGDGLDDNSDTFEVDVSDFAGSGLQDDGVENLELVNDSLTITAGTALGGGGSVSLGGSVTLNVSGPLTGIPFKTSGDTLEWKSDTNDDLILQNTTDSQTLLKVDQDNGTVFAAGDVVAFGLSGGGGGGGSSSNLVAPGGALTIDTTPDPDEITFTQDIEDSGGTTILTGPDILQFKGTAVTDVTNPAGDRVEVQIDGTTYTDADARSAVEGTSDVADLVGGLGTSGQVAQTDGSNVSWVYLSASDVSGVSPDSDADAHHTQPTTGDGLTGTTTFAVDSTVARSTQDDTITGSWEFGQTPPTGSGKAILESVITGQSSNSTDWRAGWFETSWSQDFTDANGHLEAARFRSTFGGDSSSQTGLWTLAATYEAFNQTGDTESIDNLIGARYVVQNQGGTYNGTQQGGTVDKNVDAIRVQARNKNSGSTADTMRGIAFKFMGATNNAPAPTTFKAIDLPSGEFYNLDSSGNDHWAIYDGSGLSSYFSGNVGIGTLPSDTLDVDGTIATNTELLLSTKSAEIQGQNSKINLGFSHAVWKAGSAGVDFRFRGSNNNDILRVVEGTGVAVNQSTTSYALEVSGDVRATGEVEAFLGSDRRLKTGLNPLDSALDKVERLTGYGFDWKDEDAVQPHKRAETDVGLVAQEVEDVLPEAVKTFTDGHSEGYKSVSYDKLVPLLVEAIKDLRSQVNQLK